MQEAPSLSWINLSIFQEKRKKKNNLISPRGRKSCCWCTFVVDIVKCWLFMMIFRWVLSIVWYVLDRGPASCGSESSSHAWLDRNKNFFFCCFPPFDLSAGFHVVPFFLYCCSGSSYRMKIGTLVVESRGRSPFIPPALYPQLLAKTFPTTLFRH